MLSSPGRPHTFESQRSASQSATGWCHTTGRPSLLPPAHSAGNDDHIVQTLPFEITGLELGERPALGNEIKRFGLKQFARANKFFGGNLRRRN